MRSRRIDCIQAESDARWRPVAASAVAGNSVSLDNGLSDAQITGTKDRTKDEINRRRQTKNHTKLEYFRLK